MLHAADNPRSAGSPAERAALRGGGNINPLLIREPEAVARCARPQSKALNEFFLRELKKEIVRKVTSQIRSKVKIAFFRFIGYRDGTKNSCEPKLCQQASQGMKKVAYKYGLYTK